MNLNPRKVPSQIDRLVALIPIPRQIHRENVETEHEIEADGGAVVPMMEHLSTKVSESTSTPEAAVEEDPTVASSTPKGAEEKDPTVVQVPAAAPKIPAAPVQVPADAPKIPAAPVKRL